MLIKTNILDHNGKQLASVTRDSVYRGIVDATKIAGIYTAKQRDMINSIEVNVIVTTK